MKLTTNIYRGEKTTHQFTYYTDNRTATVSGRGVGEVKQQVY